MNTLHTLRLLAMASATVLCTTDVSAEAVMQSRVTNATMGVIDLTPDDGLAAGYTIASQSTSLSAMLDVGGVYAYADSTSGASSVSIRNYSARSSEETTEETLRTSASAFAPLHGSEKLSLSANKWYTIVVEPHSMFTFAGNYALWTYGTSRADYDLFAQLKITIGRDFYYYSTWTGSGDTDFAKSFWLGYANETDVAQEIKLSLGSTGSLTDATPAALAPVPEPSSYLMLAAGLGLLGCAARRARRA